MLAARAPAPSCGGLGPRPRRLRRALRPAHHPDPQGGDRHLGGARLAHHRRVRAALADSGEFDLEATSQFVVLVAALLEMKSRLLLEEEVETSSRSSDADEAGEGLLAALVRYSQFKNAAGALQARWDEHSGPLYRQRAAAGALRRPTPRRGPARRRSGARHWRRCCASRRCRTPATSPTSRCRWSSELRRLRACSADDGAFTFVRGGAARPSREGRHVLRAARAAHPRRGALRQTRAFGDIIVTPPAQPRGAPRRARPGDAGRPLR